MSERGARAHGRAAAVRALLTRCEWCDQRGAHSPHLARPAPDARAHPSADRERANVWASSGREERGPRRVLPRARVAGLTFPKLMCIPDSKMSSVTPTVPMNDLPGARHAPRSMSERLDTGHRVGLVCAVGACRAHQMSGMEAPSYTKIDLQLCELCEPEAEAE
eukprot:1583426-Prymnesium_polylepis.1